MEQGTAKTWAAEKGIELDPSVEEKLYLYTDLICETNKKFNITGIKSRDEIMKTLVIGSIHPICEMDVPRGTKFVDIGSGAGIPGIAIGVFFEGVSGLLVESNHKKADFIHNAIDKLNLFNLKVVCDRAENVAREESYREIFDFAFARAFGSIYIIMEAGAPLLKINGLLYSYSSRGISELPEGVVSHADEMGLSFLPAEEGGKREPASGILIRKERPTPRRFPRGFAVIKREAKRIDAGSGNP